MRIVCGLPVILLLFLRANEYVCREREREGGSGEDTRQPRMEPLPRVAA